MGLGVSCVILARGMSAGKPTDVWAFRVLLYEMLTGMRVLPGSDISENDAKTIWDSRRPSR
jgi:hypothetical protein